MIVLRNKEFAFKDFKEGVGKTVSDVFCGLFGGDPSKRIDRRKQQVINAVMKKAQEDEQARLAKKVIQYFYNGMPMYKTGTGVPCDKDGNPKNLNPFF